MPIELFYQDQHVLLCCKPAGLDSEREFPARLSGETGSDPLYCVHRLDRAAGGLMVYARSKAAAAGLSAQIAEGRLRKEYLAVVQGLPEEQAVFKDLLYRDASKNKSYVVRRMRRGVREAELSYRLLERQGPWNLLRIRLVTGRSHQIRVQFASRQMPLVGDTKYGSSFRDLPLALWSCSLAFSHPVTGEALQFFAPPPLSRPWQVFQLPDC